MATAAVRSFSSLRTRRLSPDDWNARLNTDGAMTSTPMSIPRESVMMSTSDREPDVDQLKNVMATVALFWAANSTASMATSKTMTRYRIFIDRSWIPKIADGLDQAMRLTSALFDPDRPAIS